jgi:hypothetical protein
VQAIERGVGIERQRFRVSRENGAAWRFALRRSSSTFRSSSAMRSRWRSLSTRRLAFSASSWSFRVPQI